MCIRDSLDTAETFDDLLFACMDTVVDLVRDGVRVAPDVRPIMRRYVHCHGSRHTIDARLTAAGELN